MEQESGESGRNVKQPLSLLVCSSCEIFTALAFVLLPLKEDSGSECNMESLHPLGEAGITCKTRILPHCT